MPTSPIAFDSSGTALSVSLADGVGDVVPTRQACNLQGRDVDSLVRLLSPGGRNARKVWSPYHQGHAGGRRSRVPPSGSCHVGAHRTCPRSRLIAIGLDGQPPPAAVNDRHNRVAGRHAVGFRPTWRRIRKPRSRPPASRAIASYTLLKCKRIWRRASSNTGRRSI